MKGRLTISDIKPVLSASPTSSCNDTIAYQTSVQARPAAILMLLAQGQSGLEILLTKRSEHLRMHAGQVSFPGGKPEDEDSNPAMTAFRETQEETGLKANKIELLGYLPPVLTNTQYMVDLAVGYCAEPVETISRALKPAPEEVSAVWFTPVQPLTNLDFFQKVEIVRAGQRRHYWQITNSQPVIWGATAAMFRQLALRLAAYQQDI